MDDFYTYLAPNVIFSPQPDAVMNYMRDKKLLAQSFTCPTCQSQMELVSRPTSATTDGFGWRCNNQRCTKRRTFITIRTGSFFEKSRITLDKWLLTIYLWSQGSKVKTVQQQTKIGEKTVIQMFQYLRDICSTKLLNTPFQLGGPGVVVQILNLKPKYYMKYENYKIRKVQTSSDVNIGDMVNFSYYCLPHKGIVVEKEVKKDADGDVIKLEYYQFSSKDNTVHLKTSIFDLGKDEINTFYHLDESMRSHLLKRADEMRGKRVNC